MAKKLSAMLRDWAMKSQSARHMNVIAQHARPYLTVQVSQFDADPLLLNVGNGTLVIRRADDGSVSIRLKPHDPRDLITKVCSVDYDPAAKCPTYDAALTYVQPDSEIRAFLHRVMGYAATGDTSEQKLFFFYGEGRNGKSTFVEAWASVLGDYAATIPIESFLFSGHGRSGAEASPHLARLAGVRFLRTSEPERDAVLAEALIKLVTSGEPMAVRHLHHEFFDLHPQYKLFISGNHKPRIRGTDEGIWRRIVLIPWSIKIPDDRCDPHLVAKLKFEGSGILNRILEGMRDWLEHGLAIPTAIAEATADYRTASDHLGRFLFLCVRSAPGSRVSSQAMFNVYAAWAKATDSPVWSRNGFGRAMTDRGYKRTKSDLNFWLDVELIRGPSDFGASRESPPPTDVPPGSAEPYESAEFEG